MDFLAVIHGESVRSGVFGDVVRERGHALEEWSLAWGKPLPRPLDSYGAVLVFGGTSAALLKVALMPVLLLPAIVVEQPASASSAAPAIPQAAWRRI